MSLPRHSARDGLVPILAASARIPQAALQTALAKRERVGAEIIDPHFLRVAFVGLATGEEQHVGFDTLGVEDAGGHG